MPRMTQHSRWYRTFIALWFLLTCTACGESFTPISQHSHESPPLQTPDNSVTIPSAFIGIWQKPGAFLVIDTSPNNAITFYNHYTTVDVSTDSFLVREASPNQLVIQPTIINKRITLTLIDDTTLLWEADGGHVRETFQRHP